MTARRGNSGSALVNVLIFIAALSILGMALSKLSAYRMQEVQRKQNNLQARHAAESGIEEARYRLEQDPAWYADGSDSMPLIERDWGGWKYEVGVYPELGGNVYRIQSKGIARTSTRTEERTLIATSPVRYALYAMDEINLGAEVSVSGPIYAGERITGTIPSGAVVDTYPAALHTWQMPELKEYLALRPARIVDGFLQDYRIENRFLHKQGALTLRTGILTRTSIVVSGVLTVEGKTIATAAPNRPLFVVENDLLLNLLPGSQLEGVILCYGKATITGTGEIRGSIVARSIDLLGEGSVLSRPERNSIPGFPPHFNLLDR